VNKRITALALGAVVLGLSVLTVQLVSAHNRPVLFDPAPAAVLDEAPAEVTAWFAGPLRRDANWTYLRVVDADGNRVDTDELTFSEDRRQMTVGLNAGLAPGSYMVTWRSWDDDDGFILGDCYRFYVGQEAADAAIADGTRLFGGEGCETIGVSGREGTPTPEELTPTPAPDPDAPAPTPNGDGTTESSDDGDDGVPVWALAVGVIGGLVVGGVGMRLVGSRA
jgi:methionine-rich copper-binding protein CopC